MTAGTVPLDLFAAAVRIVLEDEGLLSDRAGDNGGLTKYGISKHAYPTLDIASLTVEQARHIYEWDYWRPCGCDRLPWCWALPLFDCAVNQGAKTARELLQRALGVTPDGLIGRTTLAAAERAPELAIDLFFALRALRYAAHEDWAQFGKGWMKRTHQVARLAATPPPA
jgi:lysozyme family protein